MIELKTQKPHEGEPGMRPLMPAWWPGGRTMHRALRHAPLRTSSMPRTTEPAARLAAAYEPAESLVSQVFGSLSASVLVPLACWTIGVNGTGERMGDSAICLAAVCTIAM